MKKFLSMILAIIMVFALAAPALATNHTVPTKDANTIRSTPIYSSPKSNASTVGSYGANTSIRVTFNNAKCDWASVPGGYVWSKDFAMAFGDMGRALFGTATLVKGDTGMPIQNLKEALNKILGVSMNPDSNSFGAALEENVKFFQKSVGLTVDGKVGANTKDAVLDHLVSVWPSYFHIW